MTNPMAPDWYDDPQDATAQRYWDGSDWTPSRRRKPIARSAPPPTPRPPTPLPDAPTQAARLPTAPPPPPPPPTPAAVPTQAVSIPTLPPPAPPPPAAVPAGPATPGAATAHVANRFGLLIAAALTYAGLIATAVAAFQPLLNVSTNNNAVAAPTTAKLVVVALAAVAAWLAWPTAIGRSIPVIRRIGLAVVVGPLVALLGLWLYQVAGILFGHANPGVHVSPRLGMILFGAGVIAAAVGVVRILFTRTRA